MATSYILPTPTNGRLLQITDITGNIQAPANWVSIVPHAGELINGSAGFVTTGTVTTNGTTAIVGAGTLFTTELYAGASLIISNQAGVNYIIQSIADDTHLTLTSAFTGASASGLAATRTSFTVNTAYETVYIESDGTNWITTIAGASFQDQTLWFIDPANSSGLASNTNNGFSRTTPLLNWSGLIAKWGTNSPTHTVANITITLMSAAVDDTDQLTYRPILSRRAGGATTTVLIIGDLTVSQTLAEGGTVSKNRTTNTQLALTLGAVTTLTGPTLLHNTTHDSYAWIVKRTSGKYHVTQPCVPLALPIAGNIMASMTEVDTWADADSVSVMNAPFTTYLAEISPTVQGTNGLGQVQINHLTIPSSSTLFDPFKLKQYVQVVECVVSRLIYQDLQYISVDNEAGVFNCYCTGGWGGGEATISYSNSGGVCGILAGYMATTSGNTSLAFGGVYLGFDVWVQANSFAQPIGLFGYNALGWVDLESIARGVFGVIDCTSLGPVPLGFQPAIVWGGGGLDAGNATVLHLPGTAVATFPITNTQFGSLTINYNQRAFASDDSDPPVMNGNLPITAANLDAGFRTVIASLQGAGTVHVTNGGGVATATGSKFKTELYVGALFTFSTQPGSIYRVADQSTDLSINITPNYTGSTTTTATMSYLGLGNSGLVTLTGGATFNVTSASTTVTATGSHFTTELSVGRTVTFSSQPGIYYQVSAIASDTSLTLSNAYWGTTSTTATAQGVAFGGRAWVPGGGRITCDTI